VFRNRFETTETNISVSKQTEKNENKKKYWNRNGSSSNFTGKIVGREVKENV
jgi:hypothetical protein